MSTIAIHTFPGLQPFIERAGAGRALPHLGRSCSLWHCKQVQDALGQLPRLDRESRRQLLEHIQSVRDALAAAVEGIDLAVEATTDAIDRSETLGNPEPLASKEASLARERAAERNSGTRARLNRMKLS